MKNIASAPNCGSDDVMSFLETRKVNNGYSFSWNWKRVSKPGFEHSSSNIFLFYFKGIALRTLGGL